MKFTRTDIRIILQGYGLDVVQARRATAKIVESLSAAIAADEPVELRGLGTFETKERKAHKGRNPKTGEIVEILSRRRVIFRPGKELKINLLKEEKPM